MDQNIVCYKWNNLGCKARNYRDMKEGVLIIKKENPCTTWEKNENSSKEGCRLALIIEDKEDK